MKTPYRAIVTLLLVAGVIGLLIAYMDSDDHHEKASSLRGPTTILDRPMLPRPLEQYPLHPPEQEPPKPPEMSAKCDPDLKNPSNRNETKLTNVRIDKVLADQTTRHKQVSQYCKGKGVNMNDPNWPAKVLQRSAGMAGVLYYNDEHKVIMCVLPKCGSTTWKKMFAQIEQTNHFDDLPCEGQVDLLKGIQHKPGVSKRLMALSSRASQYRLQTYYKVMFARDPLERLLSAFFSKFDNNRPARYPINSGPWWRMVDTLTEFAKKPPVPHTDNRTRTLQFNFDDFLRYYMTRPPSSYDTHWRPQTLQCNPCALQYDFIGHFETLQDDIDYVLEEATSIGDKMHFPLVHDNAGHEKFKNYYGNISTPVLQKLETIYKNDFNAHGYEPCDSMRILGRKCFKHSK